MLQAEADSSPFHYCSGLPKALQTWQFVSGRKEGYRTIKICAAQVSQQYITGAFTLPGSSVSPHGGSVLFLFFFPLEDDLYSN